MMKHTLSFVLVFGLMGIYLLYGQELNIRKIELNFVHGVAVRKIVEDTCGFIYLITQKEIFKLTGFNYEKVFTIKFNEEKNSIWNAIFLPNGRVWVLTKKNIQIYTQSNWEKLDEIVRADESPKTMLKFGHNQLAIKWENNLHHGARLILYDPTGSAYDSLDFLTDKNEIAVSPEDQSLWIQKKNELIRYTDTDIQKYPIKQWMDRLISIIPVNDTIAYGIIRGEKSIRKAVRMNPRSAVVTPLFTSDKLIIPFWQSPTLTYFVSGDKILTYRDNRFLDSVQIFAEQGDGVLCGMVDSRKLVWFVSLTKLYCIANPLFSPFLLDSMTYEINDLLAFNHQLLINSNSKIISVDTNMQTQVVYHHDNLRDLIAIDDTILGVKDKFHTIEYLNTNNWQSMGRKKLPFLANIDIKSFFCFQNEQYVMLKKEILRLNSSGGIDTVFNVDSSEAFYLKYIHRGDRADVILRKTFKNTISDSYGTFFMLFDFFINENNLKLPAFLNKYFYAYQISPDSFYLINNDSLFIGNSDSVRFVQHIPEGLKLIDMFVDPSRNLWVSISGEVFVFYPHGGGRSFSSSDGLTKKDKSLNINIMLVWNQRFLLFPRKGSFYLYQADINEKIPQLQPIRIENFWAGNSRIDLNKPIKLNYLENNFQFELADLNYQADHELDYFYRIDPIMSDWSPLLNPPYVYASGLEHGAYRVQFRVADKFGINSQTTPEYEIEIVLPFYLSNWFYFAIGLTMAGIAISFIRMRYQHQKKIFQLKQSYINTLENEVNIKTEELQHYSESLEEMVRQKTAELIRAEMKYKRIIDQTQEIIFIINRQGEFQYLNKVGINFLNLKSLDQVSSLGITSILSPYKLRRILKILDKKKSVVNYRTKISVKSVNYTFLLTVLINTENPESPLYEGVLTNVSQLVAYESALSQARKLESLGILAGGIAHEFNNLNAVIKGFSDLLSKTQVNEKQSRYLQQILNASSTLSRLTSQILSYSRQQPYESKWINPASVIHDVCSMIEHFQNTTIQIYINIDEKSLPYQIYVDPHQLNQVILNLVLNAKDALQECDSKEIIISQSFISINESLTMLDEQISYGDYLEISVKDNGPGIPRHIQQKIFEPFFSTKPVGKGTGLGLSMVYGLVKQHSGYIRLESTPGEGATFRLFFPISMSDIPPALLT